MFLIRLRRLAGRPQVLILFMVLVVGVFVPLGCGSAPVAPSGRAVTFTTEDAVTLAGKVFGAGERGVVLAHQYNKDQSSWYEMAGKLADLGYMVLAFDFRGYGTSSGVKGDATTVADLKAAVLALKEEGATRVAVVGASMGGTAAVVEAADDQLAGLVTVSAPVVFQGLNCEPYVSKVTAPKLFLASENEEGSVDTQKLFQLAHEPKQVALVAGKEHGSSIFKGPGAAKAQELLTGFLRDCLGG